MVPNSFILIHSNINILMAKTSRNTMKIMVPTIMVPTIMVPTIMDNNNVIIPVQIKTNI